MDLRKRSLILIRNLTKKRMFPENPLGSALFTDRSSEIHGTKRPSHRSGPKILYFISPIQIYDPFRGCPKVHRDRSERPTSLVSVLNDSAQFSLDEECHSANIPALEERNCIQDSRLLEWQSSIRRHPANQELQKYRYK